MRVRGKRENNSNDRLSGLRQSATSDKKAKSWQRARERCGEEVRKGVWSGRESAKARAKLDRRSVGRREEKGKRNGGGGGLGGPGGGGWRRGRGYLERPATHVRRCQERLREGPRSGLAVAASQGASGREEHGLPLPRRRSRRPGDGHCLPAHSTLPLTTSNCTCRTPRISLLYCNYCVLAP